MYKYSSAQMAAAMARGNMRQMKKDVPPHLYRDVYDKIVGGTASLQRSISAAMLLGDRLRSRNDADKARRELELAQARICKLESQLQKMDELVRADQLTGILNRRGLNEAFEREFARAMRHDTALSVALLDLDNFKRINDEYGHAAGDAILVHFAKIVDTTLRSMDVLARFGGEEFVILLPSTTPVEAMETIARIQVALAEQPCNYEGCVLSVTFSAGVTAYQAGEEKHALMRRADTAVYKAKHAGKNQAIFNGAAPQLVQEALAA